MRQAAATVRFSKPAEFPGVELSSATYSRCSFPPHSHPEFVIGAVVSGAETLQIGKQVHQAPAGTALLIHPEETHANASAGSSALSYRVMYISPSTMAEWLPGLPSFRTPTTGGRALFEAILRTHRALEELADRLTQQTQFARLAQELARTGNVGRPSPDCHPAVERARTYIDECFAADFSLTELSELAGVSRFHLIRMFKRITGLTPVAYRNQRRVEAARHLLLGRMPIAEVALEVGFADQSHLTRQFQRLMGTSPAQYRRQ